MRKHIKAVRDLYVETASYKPVDFDFSQGYGETWEIALDLTEEEQDNEEYFPMMNYMYPLPKEFEHDMERLFGQLWRSHIKKVLDNTTIVYFAKSEEYFLALTGGGMDFSWEICSSYIGLGYLPPLHFCDLPRMASKDMKDRRNRRIVKACLRSAKSLRMKAASVTAKLTQYLKVDKL